MESATVLLLVRAKNQTKSFPDFFNLLKKIFLLKNYIDMLNNLLCLAELNQIKPDNLKFMTSPFIRIFCLIIFLSFISFNIAPKVSAQPELEGWNKENLGSSYKEFQQALDAYKKADFKNAEKFFNEALETARKSKNKLIESHISFQLGSYYKYIGGNKTKAQQLFLRSSKLQGELGDKVAEQRALVAFASMLDITEDKRAEEIYQTAIKIFDENKSFSEKAITLRSFGLLEMERRNFDSAEKLLLESLELFKKINKPVDEVRCLRLLGGVKVKKGEPQLVQPFIVQALAKLEKNQNDEEKGLVLALWGDIEFALGHFPLALEKYKEVVAIFEKIHSSFLAESLLSISSIHLSLSQNDLAKQTAERALKLSENAEFKDSRAKAAGALANVYWFMGDYSEAIKLFTLEESEAEKNNDLRVTAHAQFALGGIYNILGDYKKAAIYLNKAIETQKKYGGITEQLASLYALGQVALRENKLLEAKSKFAELLKTSEEKKDQKSVANAKQMLGLIALRENNPNEAIANFTAALPIHNQTQSVLGMALTFQGLGDTLSSVKQFDQAQAIYGQALPIFWQVSSPTGESAILEGLMKNSLQNESRRAAIFYGKLSLNVLQKIRGNLSPLEVEVQKNFIASNENVYRTLAALLIEENRLSEAQEVIALFKQDEYFQYTQRSDMVVSVPQIELNEQESLAAKKYKVIFERVSASTKQLMELQQQVTLDKKEQQEKVVKISTDLQQTIGEFGSFLKETNNQFNQSALANKPLNTTTQKNWQTELSHINDGAALITALITEKKTYFILTTPNSQKSYKIDISEDEIKSKIDKVKNVLSDYRANSRPFSKELYDAVFAPMMADIKQLNVKTLLFSLDSKLRYIPMNALYDGNKYLVEDYATAVVTLAQPPKSHKISVAGNRGLGAGISKKIPELKDLPALPNVENELRSIINDGKSNSKSGIFAGKILLNEDFTLKNFNQSLSQNFNFVVIAGHFSLNPGKETDSFLPLLNKGKIDLATFRKEIKFKDIDLFTLSACNTANSSPNDEGSEIESFAVLAQKKGARTVLASLWTVADDSTTILMKDFYLNYKKQNDVYSKAQALRDAQLKMLKLSKTKSFSQPFYWSAFIVLGEV